MSEDTSILKLPLAKGSEAYVQKELEKGYDFSAFLLKNTDWQKGQCSAFLPSDASSELLTNPGSGALNTGVDGYTFDFIAEQLASPAVVLIAEDRDHSPSHVSSESNHLRKFYCNDVIYWVCNSADVEIVTETIWAASGACAFNAALCEFDINHLPENHCDADIAVLENLARRMLAIIVSAYDDVGYAIWEKT